MPQLQRTAIATLLCPDHACACAGGLRWALLGMQGALLSHFVDDLRLSTVVVSVENFLDVSHHNSATTAENRAQACQASQAVRSDGGAVPQRAVTAALRNALQRRLEPAAHALGLASTQLPRVAAVTPGFWLGHAAYVAA